MYETLSLIPRIRDLTKENQKFTNKWGHYRNSKLNMQKLV